MIEQLVEQIEARFADLEAQMSDPEVISDRARYAEVGREYRELQTASELAAKWRTLRDDLEGARELLAEGEDEEMRRVVDETPAQLMARVSASYATDRNGPPLSRGSLDTA